MAAVTFFLVASIFAQVLVVGSQLTILHSYPESGNFSYVELVCVVNDSSQLVNDSSQLVNDSSQSLSVVYGAMFQLNGTDIGEDDEIVENGTIQLLLTQEMEGFFTCSLNGSVYNTSVGLAAEPTISNFSDPIMHEVELPDSASTVSTVLECDIKAGALVQRYSVQWIQLSNITTTVISNSSKEFNLTLNVSSNADGSKYQCGVTVDHDGHISITYTGAVIIIHIMINPVNPMSSDSGVNVLQTIITMLLLILNVLLILSVAGVLLISYHRRQCRLHRRYILYRRRSDWYRHCSEFYRLRNCYSQGSRNIFREFPNYERKTNSPTLLPTLSTDETTITLNHGPQNEYVDNDNQFSLKIPDGATDKENAPKILLGMALFRPFQLPEGLRPVSPMFWVCVCDNPNFQFSKPVTVTIPHFLDFNSGNDIKSLGLTFLKADHNKTSGGLYQFEPADGKMDFNKTRGVLETTHFCCLCIAAKDIPETLKRARFCITAVLPKFSVPVGKSVNAYFFITFLRLKTCLKQVDSLIEKMGLQNYRTKQEIFQFSHDSEDPALKIDIVSPQHGKIGLMGKEMIFRSDVDFFIKSDVTEEELQILQSDKFYPPRFEVFFASFQENSTLSDAKISFSGATTDIKFNIHLDIPDHITPQSTPVPFGTLSHQHLFTTEAEYIEIESPQLLVPEVVEGQTSIDVDRDLPTAKRHLKHLSKRELKQLFQELGLFHSTVHDNLSDNSRDAYAEDLIRSWILGKDGVLFSDEYRGGATWENLKKALRKIDHHGIAETIL